MMKNFSTRSFSLSLLLSLSAACAHTPGGDAAAAGAGTAICPDAVKQSIAKNFIGATITACKAEREDGHDQFEVKLDQSGQAIEVDVAPDGAVLQTETATPVADVPARVMAAFSAKYSGKTAVRVEKQVRSGKGTFYEIKFDAQPKAKEVTFAEDGTFIEEE